MVAVALMTRAMEVTAKTTMMAMVIVMMIMIMLMVVFHAGHGDDDGSGKGDAIGRPPVSKNVKRWQQLPRINNNSATIYKTCENAARVRAPEAAQLRAPNSAHSPRNLRARVGGLQLVCARMSKRIGPNSAELRGPKLRADSVPKVCPMLRVFVRCCGFLFFGVD